MGPFRITFPNFPNGIQTWYIGTWTRGYIHLQEPESIFVLLFQSEQQKKQQEAEKQHRQERKTLRRSASHLKSKCGRGRLFHWFIFMDFLKTSFISFFIWRRDFFKLGHSTNVFVFWFIDEHKTQNLLKPVLIIVKFMKVKLLTKGHYKYHVLQTQV